jgi:hypothetical protein
MRNLKYAESIYCHECEGNVRMVGGRLVKVKSAKPTRVEIDYSCVECGAWGTATRDGDYLPYSEREFCEKHGIIQFSEKAIGRGVVFYSVK